MPTQLLTETGPYPADSSWQLLILYKRAGFSTHYRSCESHRIWASKNMSKLQSKTVHVKTISIQVTVPYTHGQNRVYVNELFVLTWVCVCVHVCVCVCVCGCVVTGLHIGWITSFVNTNHHVLFRAAFPTKMKPFMALWNPTKMKPFMGFLFLSFHFQTPD